MTQLGSELGAFFYDHIIRNDEEYCLIWEYIDSNPINWQDDTQYGSI